MRAMRGGLAGVVRRQEVGQASAALSRRERMRPVPRSGRPGSMPPTRPVTRGTSRLILATAVGSLATLLAVVPTAPR
jgi:hypothetical protein